jgi:hypothetical protein
MFLKTVPDLANGVRIPSIITASAMQNLLG